MNSCLFVFLFDCDYAVGMLLQASLLDEAVEIGFGVLTPTRLELPGAAWIDHQPAWLAGSDALFDALLPAIDWRDEVRPMYDAVVAVPRLTRFYAERERLPHPLVAQARDLLTAHYRRTLGEPFRTVGACLYRDGRDSVAWHGDRTGRSSRHDTLIALLSLGAPRTLTLRRRGGGPTRHRFALGHGDLLVMGGSCQRTWEHAVPKTADAVGPRISLQFRPRGVL